MKSSSASVDRVVVDAGPLIALARLQLLKLPARLFREVLVTDIVVAECLTNPAYPEHTSIQSALEHELLKRHEWKQSQSAAMWNLDAGEASTIDLSIRLGIAVLIDDLAARRVARALQAPTLGTCGLLLLAKRKGYVDELKPLLGSLIDSGYFLGERLVERVLRMGGET